MSATRFQTMLCAFAVLCAVFALGAAHAANFSVDWTSPDLVETMSVDWADYDEDGDADIVEGNSGSANRVFQNNGAGVYSLIWSSTETDDTRSVAWGDYDGDGDLDLAAGNAGEVNRVYRMDAANTLTLVWSSTEVDDTRSVAWGDYDQDGDPDLLVGNFGDNNRIYRNDGGGVFTLAASYSPSSQTTAAIWCDLDGDRDLDFVEANNTQANRVYRNTTGVFASSWSSTETDGTNAVACGDYDGDGDLDLLFGNSGVNGNRLYRNDGIASFTLVWTSTETDATTSVAWGDFDNDGDLDHLAGNSGAPNRIYRNDGGGAFALDWSSAESDATNQVIWGQTATGDSSADHLVANASVQYNKVYMNAPGVANTAPAAPALTAESDAPPGSVTLQWTAGTDTQTTDADLLSYDLRLGTTSGGCEVYCGVFSGPGKARGLSHIVTLPIGSYYWSMRTVDTAYARSAWSAEDSFVIDSTAPSDVTVSDGPGADWDYTPSGVTLQANWSASAEGDSTLARYWYSIGTLPGASNTVSWTNNGLATSVTKGGLTLTDGVTYYISVRAENSAGLQSNTVSSDGQMSDTTAPANVAAAVDGTGTDVDYTSSGNTLSANWSASSDGESGIQRYWYSIGTSAGASDTVVWTDNATATTITKTGLTLTDGATYYFSIRPENNARTVSAAVTTTDGQISDTTAPSIAGATVNDGPYTDMAYATSASILAANWSGFAEPHSGIAVYYYSIGTSAGASDTVSWTNNATATTVTKTGLTLTDGQIYYVNVKAGNNADLISLVKSSNGQTVDSTEPVSAAAVVKDGPDVDLGYATSANTLKANWSGFSEPDTSITHYWYAIGTTAGNTDTTGGWVDNGTSASFSNGTLTLADGQIYYTTVKAENESGLVSVPVITDGQIVDTTPPANVATVNDGHSTDADYTSSTTALTANWTASSDAHTGIKRYWYAIGTAAGATDVTGWVNNGTNASVTHAGTFTNGVTYYFTIKAENNAGLQSTPANSDGITVDVSNPSTIATVNDSTGADMDYIANNTDLSANWSASADGQSSIKQYWYSIGTTAGASNTVAWTSTGLGTSFTETGLPLVNGQVYYVTVTAENYAGLYSTPVTSDGQMVDVTTPDPVTVLDGGTTDIAYTVNNTQLSAYWTPSADDQSGVLTYWYSIGTTAGASDTVAWTDNGAVNSVTRAALALTDGQTYYFTVQAENNSRLMSSLNSSDGQIVDASAPSDVAAVNDGDAADITYSRSGTQIVANWSASADPHSGIKQYWYSVGTTAGASNTVSWTNAGASTSVTRTGLTLAEGQTYYVSVRAENNTALLSNPVSSNGQLIDTIAPTALTYVYDGTGADQTYTTSGVSLSANWSASTDSGSGMARYWYSVGTSSGASDTVSWTDNGLAASVTVNSLTLTDGVTYYFTIKAEDVSQWQNTAVSSNGILKDSSAPQNVAHVYDGLSADVDVTTAATSLGANWAAAAEPHSGIATYYYSIGTSPGSTNFKAWTATTGTSVVATGLTLVDGATYYFNIKSENLAGVQSGVVSSNGATYNAQPPVAIVFPEDGSQVTGVVVVTGTASDLSVEGWHLYYGPGITPTEFDLINSGTVSVTDGVLGSWNTSSLSGDYTLQLVVSDTLGAQSTASVHVIVSNTMITNSTMQSGEIRLAGIAVQPSPSDPMSIFGATAEYKVLRWNPLTNDDPDIGKYRSPSELKPGYGYWLLVYEDNFSYSVEGSPVDTTTDFTLEVKTGWNQIASPYLRSYPWDQIRVSDANGTYDYTTAVANGLIAAPIYNYDSTRGTFVLNEISPSLTYGCGFFMRAYRDVTLIFDPGAGMPGGVARVVRPKEDYRIQLAAAAPLSSDQDNYIVSMAGADQDFDRYDAPEPPHAPAAAYTTLYFPRDSWTENPGRYTAESRPLARSGEPAEQWPLAVETSESGQTVTLSWNSSLPTDRYTFTLVDNATGERIDMASRDTYTYTAGAGVSTRTFTIQVAQRGASDVETAAYTLAPGWNLISVPLDPQVTSALEQLGDDLPLLTVYQYFDGQFYAADKADIQSGLGYWVYVAADASIDITGVPAPRDRPVAVPLAPGWNLIGNPFAESLAWGDNIQIEAQGAVRPFAAAAALGLVSATVFEFDGAQYVPLAPGAALEPWKGYLIKSGIQADLLLSK